MKVFLFAFITLSAALLQSPQSSDWALHGLTNSEQRFSRLDLINETNVSRLGLAWHYKLDIDRGTEATPIVIDGRMYTTGAFSIVYAFNAVTGKLLWKYDPSVPREYGARACCDAVNRGVAVVGGRVFVATLDGYLVALNARSGKVEWRIDTIIDRTRAYTITGAPRIVAGKIVIGNGGAEFGVRGYLTAYDPRTGKQQWRFFTVPGDPSKPFESRAMEMAAKTWTGEWWKYGGGGTVWDSMSYDPELDLLYVGVGNGSPWVRKYRSSGGGDNLFLSSIVALKAGTGEYVWHYQTTPGDAWDYTATQHMILADLAIGGRTRRVIMQAPKNGFFYVLDRQTGELLSAEKYVNVTWATHVDMKTGRPAENPAVADYSKESRLIFPSPYGGHNWQPMTFHPGTGLVYIPAQELPIVMTSDPEFKVRSPLHWNTGILVTGIPEDKVGNANLLAITGGKLIAWDPVRAREVWRIDQEHPFNGGVLATAGNLVFQGTADGKFVAYSAKEGKKLWEAPARTGIVAPPITYAIDGQQYVTVMAGWGGVLALVGGSIAKAAGVRSISRVLTFKLDGKRVLPELPAMSAPPAPPPQTATPAVIDRGRTGYYQYCATCHGAAAVGGGVIQDLRYLDAAQHSAFEKTVRGGLPSKGMPAFADVLSASDVEGIRAYIIKRAHDEK